MTQYTPRQIADAINEARQKTLWQDYTLVVDTAAFILAGPQASDELVDDARAQIERVMK